MQLKELGAASEKVYNLLAATIQTRGLSPWQKKYKYLLPRT